MIAALIAKRESIRIESVQESNKTGDEPRIEFESEDMDIEGPPKTPLRSATCLETGDLILRL